MPGSRTEHDKPDVPPQGVDVFIETRREGHQIGYKTLMIAEIMSNAMLTLPSALADIGKRTIVFRSPHNQLYCDL